MKYIEHTPRILGFVVTCQTPMSTYFSLSTNDSFNVNRPSLFSGYRKIIDEAQIKPIISMRCHIQQTSQPIYYANYESRTTQREERVVHC